MKRLETTMVSTMTRRLILKYAAAMSTALVLPASVVAAGADLDSSPIGETPVPRDLAELTSDERLQRASDNATDSFRHDFAFVAGTWSQDALAKWISKPDWQSESQDMRDEIVEALSPTMEHWKAGSHAQFMIWAMESHAAGYRLEQCSIDFPMIDGERVMSLVCRLEGFAGGTLGRFAT